VLANDWTLRHGNHYYQALEANQPLPRPGTRILVRTHLDGRQEFIYIRHILVCNNITCSILRQKEKKEDCGTVLPESVPGTGKKTASLKPDCTHPWRQGCSRMRNEAVR
jgi:hypothetical protein